MMRTLSPSLNLGFQNPQSCLLYRMDKKSDFFTFYGVESGTFSSRVKGCNKLSKFLNDVLVSIIFQVIVKYNF